MGGESIGVDILLHIKVLGDIDDASFNGLFWSDFKQLLVASSFVSFLVESCRFDSKRPRSFDPRIFFVAVIISTVINSNQFSMYLFIMLGEMCESDLIGEVEEELEMHCAFFAFLQLASDVSAFGDVFPLAEILLA